MREDENMGTRALTKMSTLGTTLSRALGLVLEDARREARIRTRDSNVTSTPLLVRPEDPHLETTIPTNTLIRAITLVRGLVLTVDLHTARVRHAKTTLERPDRGAGREGHYVPGTSEIEGPPREKGGMKEGSDVTERQSGIIGVKGWKPKQFARY